MAAITVSGRHALLVGYQPDEALRPSLATLFLSRPFAPSVPLYPSFFLSPSFEISSSRAVASRGTGVYRRNFIPTRAARGVSLRSLELTGSCKNLGRTLLASRTILYLAILTRTSYMLLTLSTRVSIEVPFLREINVVQMIAQKRYQEKSNLRLSF